MSTAVTKGLQLRFYSFTGDFIGLITDNSDEGSTLDLSVFEGLNGVEDITFNLPRTVNIPLSRNSRVDVYSDGVKQFTAYVNDIPEPDQTEAILQYTAFGYSNLFERIIVNESYTSQTFDTIIKDILNTYLADTEVVYSAGNISSPSISSIDIEFNDLALTEVLSWLTKLANYDYNTTKYRWYITADLEIVFESYGSSIAFNWFEGFQFQEPEVEVDASLIINSVMAYRSTAAGTDTIEYVSTTQDTDSIALYGLYERKITFPDYLDSTTIGNIANAIIERSASITKRMVLLLQTEDYLAPGLYRVSNRRQEYWQTINDCESLTGWDISALVSATIAVSTTKTLTGRRSLKLDYTASSSGHIKYTLDTPIPLPFLVRSFVYFVTGTVDIDIRFYDTTGSFTSIELSSGITNQWIKAEKEVPLISDEFNMIVNDTVSTTKNLIVNYDAVTTYQLIVRKEAESSIRNVAYIEFRISPSDTGSFYIDNFAAKALSFKASDLLFEKAEYTLSSTQKEVKLYLGNKPSSLLDSIAEGNEEGKTAFNIFSKT